MKRYHAWFGRYVRPFLRDAGSSASAIGLKIVHSQRVRYEILGIAAEIGLGPKDLLLAGITGLFHDIGRFEQFHRFNTFVDSQSIDHAQMSRDVLEREGALEDLSSADRSIILDAVFYHNKLTIPDSFDGRREIMSRLVRDADKLDILRVFDDLYKKGRGSDAVNLGLPDSQELSGEVLEDFLQARVVNFKNVKTSTDFLVMRLSWLYDINFSYTLKMILERGYLESMEKQLPHSAWSEEIFENIRHYLETKIPV